MISVDEMYLWDNTPDFFSLYPNQDFGQFC